MNERIDESPLSKDMKRLTPISANDNDGVSDNSNSDISLLVTTIFYLCHH